MTAKLISVRGLRQGIPPEKSNGPTVIDFSGPFLDAPFTLIFVADTDETQKKYSRAEREKTTFLNFHIMYYAVIYNRNNRIIRIEERETTRRAEQAAEYFANMINEGWWAVLGREDNEWIDAYEKGRWL